MDDSDRTPSEEADLVEVVTEPLADDDGVPVTVTVGAEDGRLSVEVRDRGEVSTVGVAPDDAEADLDADVVNDGYSYETTLDGERTTLAFAATPSAARAHLAETVRGSHRADPPDFVDELFLPLSTAEDVAPHEFDRVESVRLVEEEEPLRALVSEEGVTVHDLNELTGGYDGPDGGRGV